MAEDIDELRKELATARQLARAALECLSDDQLVELRARLDKETGEDVAGDRDDE